MDFFFYHYTKFHFLLSLKYSEITLQGKRKVSYENNLFLLINLSYELEADLITVAEVIPGKSLSRPTFLLSSVQT